MKKVLLIIFSIFLLCFCLVACDRNEDEIPKDNKTRFFTKLETIKENIADKRVNIELPKTEINLDELDFEITDFTSDDSTTIDDVSSIIFKDKTLYLASDNDASSIILRLEENQIFMIQTDSGDTKMTAIPFTVPVSNEAPELEFDPSLIFTEDDLIETDNEDKYELSQDYIEKIIDKLNDLVDNSISQFYDIEIYLYFNDYDNGIVKADIFNDGIGIFTAIFNVDALANGNGTITFSIEKEEEKILDVSVELQNFKLEKICLSVNTEGTKASAIIEKNKIEATMELEEQVISIFLEQKESNLENMLNYSLVIELQEEATSIKSSIELDILAELNNETEKTYSINVKISDENGEQDGTAKLYFPSKSEAQVTPLEAKYLERIEVYQANKAEIEARATSFLTLGVAYFQKHYNRFIGNSEPEMYYYLDEDFDLIYLSGFDYNEVNNTINYSLNVVLDYENNIYFAHRVIDTFDNAEESIFENEARVLYIDACDLLRKQQRELTAAKNYSNYYAYYYNNDKNIYIVININKGEHKITYQVEKPTEKEFSKSLCELKYVDGVPMYHNLEHIGYDEDNYKMYKCSECDNEYKSKLQEGNSEN